MNKVKVTNGSKIIYYGNILDIPIKSERIIEKSIEVFDDDDPCIIHKSYVIKMFVDDMLTRTNLKTVKKVNLSEFLTELDYFDFVLDDSIIYYEDL